MRKENALPQTKHNATIADTKTSPRKVSMASVIPRFSKEKVKKAGGILIDYESSYEALDEAFMVLDNWRSSHIYPMNTFQAGLRHKMKKLEIDGLVAQRLKRIPSIYAKLARFKTMSLSRMQDIGGLRAVVANVKQVYALRDSYVLKSRFDHILVAEHDYIKQPKPSGYRGIHLVYKYVNRKGSGVHYEGLQIELQIRNNLQHAWATAVETAGVFLDQALKSSIGNEKWLEFFCYASSSFAILESSPVYEGHRELSKTQIFNKMLTLEEELEVTQNLSMYNLVVEPPKGMEKNTHYYLMRLDAASMKVDITGFGLDALSEATDQYLTQERAAKDQSGVQVVLVAAQSLSSLKKAYPNYFLDTGRFVSRIKRIRSMMAMRATAENGKIMTASTLEAAAHGD
jgi:putative GTP pyrophosphokinase